MNLKRTLLVVTLKLFTISYLCLINVFVTAQPFSESVIDESKGSDAKIYQAFTFDGAWCWFSDPRAIYYEGVYKRTYAGWIDSKGNIYIGYYDHETNKTNSAVIYEGITIDDHNNPSLLIDKSGYLQVFFSEHGAPSPIYMARSKKPEDISVWENINRLAINDTFYYEDLTNSYTYTNPIYLSDEGKTYLFWRGIDYKPSYSVSEDNGITWTNGRFYILPDRSYDMRRPYVKMMSNGKDKIHFIFTDGHPRKEPQNSVYYMYYKNGTFFKANGKEIKKLNEGNVHPSLADKVYDASKTNTKAWIWDIAEDTNGFPVLAYTKFPDDSNHIYCYARWNGTEWENYDLVNSGGWFPHTPDSIEEREPNYSGGMSIDKEGSSTLYLSVKRKGIFEIEKWTTNNGGKKWEVMPITKGSSKDNVRPVAIKNAQKENPLQVLWMSNNKYVYYYIDYNSAIKMNIKSQDNYEK